MSSAGAYNSIAVGFNHASVHNMMVRGGSSTEIAHFLPSEEVTSGHAL